MRVDLGVADAELSVGDPSACLSPREQRSKVNSNTLVKMQRDTSNRRATSPARHSLKPETCLLQLGRRAPFRGGGRQRWPCFLLLLPPMVPPMGIRSYRSISVTRNSLTSSWNALSRSGLNSGSDVSAHRPQAGLCSQENVPGLPDGLAAASPPCVGPAGPGYRRPLRLPPHVPGEAQEEDDGVERSVTSSRAFKVPGVSNSFSPGATSAPWLLSKSRM